ncbi:unnamed protein product, partial [Mesorhabditis spiculigera]
MAEQTAPVQADYDVVIVGAGVSGLATAHELRKRAPDLKVLIVEAKNRVGGRTLTVDLKGRTDKPEKFDLGGQWVGKTQSHILEIMKELRIQTYDQYTDGIKLAQMGDVNELRPYVSALSEKNLRHYTEVELLDFFTNNNKLKALCDKLDLIEIFDSQDAADLDQMTVSQWTKDNCQTDTVEDVMELGSRIVYGVPFTRMSMLYHLFFSKSAGGYQNLVESIGDGAQAIRLHGGTQQISEKLAQPFIEREQLKFNTAVNRIDVDTKTGLAHVRMYATKSKESVLRMHVVKTKRVVMAIPPTECGKIRWVPEVPFIKRRLFDNLYFGNMIKFVVTYKRSFWREKGFSGEVVSMGRTTEEGEMLPIVDAYDGCAPGGTPAIVGFMREEYADHTKEERCKEAVDDLARIFGEEAKDFIDYDEKVWGQEPFNGGCPVAYVPPGQMDAFAAIREPHHNVHFAGTESATHWMGYMSGAVQAGRRAAHEVLHMLDRDDVVHFSYLADSMFGPTFLEKQQNETTTQPKSKI